MQGKSNSRDNAANLFEGFAKFVDMVLTSHAAAYAMIAYQTAFSKTNYPMEFFCA